MTTRILTASDVRDLLPVRSCIDVVEDAWKSLARGEGVNPLRSALRFPDGSGLLGMMPAQLDAPRASGIKVVTVTPGNHGTPFDSHQGAVLVFEPEHGSLAGVIDASSVTAIRTAAASAAATRLLAREDASRLALLGSGVQAATHLDAMLAVRPVERVLVWSRSPENARRFAENASAKVLVPVEAAASAEEAVRAADLVCTVTSAREPVLEGRWLAPGTHVNAVGACLAAYRELDTEAVRRARLFTDRRESAEKEAGDYLVPLREGAIGPEHLLGEIGEILLGRLRGRRSGEEITLFESLGIGVEDLAVGCWLLERAAQAHRGIVVDLAGRRWSL